MLYVKGCDSGKVSVIQGSLTKNEGKTSLLPWVEDSSLCLWRCEQDKCDERFLYVKMKCPSMWIKCDILEHFSDVKSSPKLAGSFCATTDSIGERV